MNRSENILEKWAFRLLERIYQQESMLLNDNMLDNPSNVSITDYIDFGSDLKRNYVHILHYLYENHENLSSACLVAVGSLSSLLVKRQKAAKYPGSSECYGLWSCANPWARIHTDMAVDFIAEYSALCATFQYYALKTKAFGASTSAVMYSITDFFEGWCHGGAWVVHGFDRNLDLDCYGQILKLGLIHWVRDVDPNLIPDFYLAAERLVAQEAREGQWHSPWEVISPEARRAESRFSLLGAICLEALAARDERLRP